jgi:hypothetical protein
MMPLWTEREAQHTVDPKSEETQETTETANAAHEDAHPHLLLEETAKLKYQTY